MDSQTTLQTLQLPLNHKVIVWLHSIYTHLKHFITVLEVVIKTSTATLQRQTQYHIF